MIRDLSIRYLDLNKINQVFSHNPKSALSQLIILARLSQLVQLAQLAKSDNFLNY